MAAYFYELSTSEYIDFVDRCLTMSHKNIALTPKCLRPWPWRQLSAISACDVPITTCLLNMGGNQSIPKVTPQDRAVLECVCTLSTLAYALMRSLKSQASARQIETVSEKGMSITLPGISWIWSFCWKLQVILDREHEIAKANLAANRKDRAVIALRRRKYQQGLLSKTDGQLEKLEQLVSCINHR
jgi:hypothetical protein